MGKNVAIVASMLALLVYSQSDIEAEKKEKAKEFVKASAADYAELAKMPEITGKLLLSDDKTVSFRTEFQTWVPNPAFKPGSLRLPAHLQARYDHLMRDQVEVLRIKNLAERQRRALHNAQEMDRLNVDISKHFAADKSLKSGPYKLVPASRDFELALDSKVEVRWANPPTVDEKSASKVYTKEELEKLKSSDPKVPGYRGSVSQLIPGQTIRCFLNAPEAKKTTEKTTDKTTEKTTDKATDKTTDKAPDKVGAGEEPRPTVRMILIVEESTLLDPKAK
jgi:hypothetical protein